MCASTQSVRGNRPSGIGRAVLWWNRSSVFAPGTDLSAKPVVIVDQSADYRSRGSFCGSLPPTRPRRSRLRCSFAVVVLWYSSAGTLPSPQRDIPPVRLFGGLVDVPAPSLSLAGSLPVRVQQRASLEVRGERFVRGVTFGGASGPGVRGVSHSALPRRHEDQASVQHLVGLENKSDTA